MDGFINLDKQSGVSSQHMVSALRRLLKSKAGHCGTLDPMATGVLPVALGRATRLAEYIMGREKHYLAEIRFGTETVSYDADGETVRELPAAHISADMLQALLPRYTGPIMQRPPAVSALKRGGEPLYRKVLRGEEVITEPRAVMIYSLRLLEFIPGEKPLAKLLIACGQGAYIRSLAHDFGAELGCGAHLSSLRRLKVGEFRSENSFTLERIESALAEGCCDFLIPMSEALSHMPALIAGADALPRLLHGNDAVIGGSGISAEQLSAPALRIISESGQFIGIGHIKNDADGATNSATNKDGIICMDKVLLSHEDMREKKNFAEATSTGLSVAAIGNFDGLHLGHQALFAAVREARERLGGHSAAVTFQPHPLAIIRGSAPPSLSGEQMKRELLCDCFGLDQVITLDFDRRMMNLSPERFVEDIIIGRLRAREIVVGYNFTYAAHGAGTARSLQAVCAEFGVRVTIIDEVSGPYGTVSSSNIRRALEQGDMAAVNAMLGYWFAMEGEVVYGNQIGRSIGFPTANFFPESGHALPPTGVFAARILHGGRLYDGVVNFGVKPTIGGERKPLVEANIFDAELPLYGETIRVYFGAHLRAEKRFSGLEELKAQITADSASAREFLRQNPVKNTLPNGRA